MKNCDDPELLLNSMLYFKAKMFIFLKCSSNNYVVNKRIRELVSL